MESEWYLERLEQESMQLKLLIGRVQYLEEFKDHINREASDRLGIERLMFAKKALSQLESS